MVVNRAILPRLHTQMWYENSALFFQWPDLLLKSQNISNLLAKVGDSDIPSIFMDKTFQKSWDKKHINVRACQFLKLLN